MLLQLEHEKKKGSCYSTIGNVHARCDSMPVRAKTGHVATKNDTVAGPPQTQPTVKYYLFL